MLYDNAQLLRVYVHWIRLGGNAVFPVAEAADVAGRTGVWLLESLGLGLEPRRGRQRQRAPRVALASSLDADTVVDGVHHEGASYLWTPAAWRKCWGRLTATPLRRLMNVGAEGTVSADGFAAAPRPGVEGGDAELWKRVRPALLAGADAAAAARP